MGAYEELRNNIKSGDIIAFKVSKYAPFFAHILKAVLKQDIYHIGIAVWLLSEDGHRRLFIVEASKGNRIVTPLSKYKNEPVDVYPLPFDFSNISEALLDRVGSVHYAYLDLLSIYLKEKFNMNVHDFNGEVCSEMVLDMLMRGGMKIDNDLYSPFRVTQILEDNGINKKYSYAGEHNESKRISHT